MAFGTGSAIANRAVDAVAGPRQGMLVCACACGCCLFYLPPHFLVFVSFFFSPVLVPLIYSILVEHVQVNQDGTPAAAPAAAAPTDQYAHTAKIF